MKQTYAPKSTLGFLSGLWTGLVRPAPRISQLDRQWQSRLLATLLLLLIALTLPAAFLSVILTPADPVWRVPEFLIGLITALLLALLYWLNRAGYLKLAAISTTGLFLVVVFAATVINLMGVNPYYRSDNPGLLIYVILPILLGIMLLSVRALVITLIVVLTGMLLLPLLFPQVTYAGLIMGPFLFVAVISIIVVLLTHYRNRLEADRLSLVATTRDELAKEVAERKRAEEQVFEYEELDKLKSDFLSVVSHELRTPLTAIKGYSTMLLDYDQRLSPEEKRAHLGSIDRATDRLTGLVERILDVSHLEAGLIKLEKAPTSISKLVREVVDGARLRAPGHNMVLDLERRLPRMNVDAKRIRQVLDNIIDNATRYSKEGTAVVVSARRTGQGVLVSVTDQGGGIPAGDLERVFERMYRTEEKPTAGVGGVGLGLAICKGLVEAHGGQIWVESRAGEGSTFYLTLPKEAAA